MAKGILLLNIGLPALGLKRLVRKGAGQNLKKKYIGAPLSSIVMRGVVLMGATRHKV
jgi:hypothetical protein